jgi:hypothetical protein
MPKVDALSAGQQEIVQALMKEIGGMNLLEMVSRAVAEGTRLGLREALRAVGQQLQNVNPGDAGVVESAPPNAVGKALIESAKPNGSRTGHAIGLAAPRAAAAEEEEMEAKVDGVATNAKKAECPVPRCKELGVRQYHNFCKKHYNKLSEAEIKSYRAKQALAKTPPPRNLVKCPVPECRNPGVKPLKNFCQEHHRDLSPAVKLELRDKQLSDHRKKRREEHKAAQAG